MPQDAGAQRLQATSMYFPYGAARDYSAGVASMSYARDYAQVGDHVAMAMRVPLADEKLTGTGLPHLHDMAVDTGGADVGPLRIWQRRAGNLHAAVRVPCTV